MKKLYLFLVAIFASFALSAQTGTEITHLLEIFQLSYVDEELYPNDDVTYTGTATVIAQEGTDLWLHDGTSGLLLEGVTGTYTVGVQLSNFTFTWNGKYNAGTVVSIPETGTAGTPSYTTPTVSSGDELQGNYGIYGSHVKLEKVSPTADVTLSEAGSSFSVVLFESAPGAIIDKYGKYTGQSYKTTDVLDIEGYYIFNMYGAMSGSDTFIFYVTKITASEGAGGGGETPIEIANPVASIPSQGAIFASSITVELTSETAGANIYYTVDKYGSDPKNVDKRTLYEGPITIQRPATGSGTLYLKAVSELDGNYSDVVEFGYTFAKTYSKTNLGALSSAANIRQNTQVTGEVIVTFYHNNTLFVQDNTRGLIVTGVNEGTYEAGDVLQNIIVNPNSDYNNIAEVVAVQIPAAIRNEEAPAPIEDITPAELDKNYYGMYVRFEGLTLPEGLTANNDVVEFKIADETKEYTAKTFFGNIQETLPAGTKVNVEAIVGYNNGPTLFYVTAMEVLPTFECAGITGFADWGNSYVEHVVDTLGFTLTFEKASEQTQNIKDIPVTKGSPVTLVLNDPTKQITSIRMVARQWNTKAQTITLHTTTDGTNFTATDVTSSTFDISSDALPTNTTGVKFTFSSTNSQIGIESFYITTADKVEIAVEAPVLSEESGLKLNAFDLEITCPTEGASIYYTLDGKEPTAESTPYESAIAISATTTVKAVAINGEDKSDVVTTTYTFPVEVSDIAAFIEKADAENYVKIAGAVTVTFQNGSNLFVQDASGSIQIYGSGLAQHNNGDVLTGVIGKYKLYNGNTPEVVDPILPTAVAGEPVTPTRTLIGMISNNIVNKYIMVYKATVGGTDSIKFNNDAKNISLIQNEEDEIVARSAYKNIKKNFAPGDIVNVTGIVSIYNGNPQLNIIDIKQVPATPEVSVPEGIYFKDFKVALSCKTPGATIRYELNGYEYPSATSGIIYNEGDSISLTEEQYQEDGHLNILAIAVLDGVESSVLDVMYTIQTPVKCETIKDANPFINEDQASSIVEITGTVTVTGQYTVEETPSYFSEGGMINYLFVQDATAGMLIKGSKETYNVGDQLTGIVVEWIGMWDMSAANAVAMPKGVAGTAATPTALTEAELQDMTKFYQLSVLENVTIREASALEDGYVQVYFSDDEDASPLTIMDKFGILADATYNANTIVDIEGYYMQDMMGTDPQIWATKITVKPAAPQYATYATLAEANEAFLNWVTDDIKITGTVTVTGVVTTKHPMTGVETKSLFVQDATAGFVLTNFEGEYKVGDQLTGITFAFGYGLAEGEVISLPEAVAKDTVIAPIEVTFDDLDVANFPNNCNRFVKVSNLVFKNETSFANGPAAAYINVNLPGSINLVDVTGEYADVTYTANTYVDVEGFNRPEAFPMEIWATKITIKSGTNTGVDNAEVLFTVYSNNGTLFVESAEGAAINVFDINGRQIANTVANSTTTSFSNLNVNHAIVTVDGTAVKVMVK